MKTEDIFKKISEIEEQLNKYRTERQEELNIYLVKTGVSIFLAETDRQVAYFQGQIDTLKSLLGKEEIKPEEIDN